MFTAFSFSSTYYLIKWTQNFERDPCVPSPATQRFLWIIQVIRMSTREAKFKLELSQEQLSAKDLTCTIDPTCASSLITAKQSTGRGSSNRNDTPLDCSKICDLQRNLSAMKTSKRYASLICNKQRNYQRLENESGQTRQATLDQSRLGYTKPKLNWPKLTSLISNKQGNYQRSENESGQTGSILRQVTLDQYRLGYTKPELTTLSQSELTSQHIATNRTRTGQNNVTRYITLRVKLTVSAGREPLTWHFPPITVPPSGTIDPLPAKNRKTRQINMIKCSTVNNMLSLQMIGNERLQRYQS